MNDNSPTRQALDWKKYILAFIITAIIFGVGMYINSKLDEKRYAEIQNIQDSIALDLLSSETQFSLLQESSCKNFGESVLSGELNSLSEKLAYMETNDPDNKEITYLKKYYSLLEIKDFVLMNRLSEKCKTKPISILYFYGNKEDCPECEKMGFVLTYLREQYPDLRIYSFDSNLSLSAIDTLKSVYKVDSRALPALIIGEDTYTGFRDIDAVKTLIPELKKIDQQKLASSTKAMMSSSSSSTSTKR